MALHPFTPHTTHPTFRYSPPVHCTMRSIIVASLFVAALVSAQDLSDLPTCAQDCFTSSIGSSSCSFTDTACLCKDTAFQAVIEACATKGCTTEEQAKATAFSVKNCGAAGVTGVASSAAAGASSAAASASAVKSSASSAVSSASASASAAAKPSGSSNSGAGKVATGGILAAVGVVGALFF